MMNKKDLVKYCYSFIANILDKIIIISNKKLNNNSGKICIIKVDGIGDGIIFLPYLIRIKEYYERFGKEVYLVCSDSLVDLYSIEFDRQHIIPINIKDFFKFKYRYDKLKKIRNMNFDTILNCAYSRTISIESIVKDSGSTVRIGFKGDCTNMPKKLKERTDLKYTSLFTNCSDISEIDRDCSFTNWVTGEERQTQLANIQEYCDYIEMPNVDYFVIFPGASMEQRCWPPDHFGEVANLIFKRTGWSVVIAGGKNEQERCSRVQDTIYDKEKVLNLSGKTSLKQLATIIKNAKMIVTNDTGALHIAGAFKTPTLGIAKACDLGRFVPYPEELLTRENFTQHIICSKNSYECNNIHTCSKGLETYRCIADIHFKDIADWIEFFI